MAQRSPSARLQGGEWVSLEVRRALSCSTGVANVKSNDDYVMQLARAGGAVDRWLL